MKRPAIIYSKAYGLLSEEAKSVPVALLGIRGYFLNTMGKPLENDRGLYDDAIIVISPTSFMAFNANTDPSKYKFGVASLLPGTHWYKRGNHGISRPGGGYPAFRPATLQEKLPVSRDGVKSNPAPGVAINIHRGGYSTTSSEGCQTIYPDQWDEFYALVDCELKRHKQDKFPYVLVENTPAARLT